MPVYYATPSFFLGLSQCSQQIAKKALLIIVYIDELAKLNEIRFKIRLFLTCINRFKTQFLMRLYNTGNIYLVDSYVMYIGLIF